MENEGTDGSVITSLLLDEKNKFFSDGYEVSLICDGYDIPINRDKAKKIIRWLQKEFNLGEKNSEEMPEWCAIGKWVYDKVSKTIQCINSTSYYLVSIKVELYFINGSSWSGNVAELKTRFVPAEVKIGQ